VKRYAVFAGRNYYPRGGWSDFQESFDTIPEARLALTTGKIRKHDWWEIVDLTIGRIVEEGRTPW